MSQKRFLTTVDNLLQTKDPRSRSFALRVLNFDPGSGSGALDAKLETIFEVNL